MIGKVEQLMPEKYVMTVGSNHLGIRVWLTLPSKMGKRVKMIANSEKNL